MKNKNSRTLSPNPSSSKGQPSNSQHSFFPTSQSSNMSVPSGQSLLPSSIGSLALHPDQQNFKQHTNQYYGGQQGGQSNYNGQQNSQQNSQQNQQRHQQNYNGQQNRQNQCYKGNENNPDQNYNGGQGNDNPNQKEEPVSPACAHVDTSHLHQRQLNALNLLRQHQPSRSRQQQLDRMVKLQAQENHWGVYDEGHFPLPHDAGKVHFPTIQ
jgi:hypothetical protein